MCHACRNFSDYFLSSNHRAGLVSIRKDGGPPKESIGGTRRGKAPSAYTIRLGSPYQGLASE